MPVEATSHYMAKRARKKRPPKRAQRSLLAPRKPRLPSLKLEGGPDPWELVPDSQGFAALMAGFFAARAGLPPPPTAPTVREFQHRQAEVALPWAARELGLPPPT